VTFEELVREAEVAPLTGWDFSWLDGRASEQRPSWGYAAAMARRLATVQAALDVQTGGGEVLDSAPSLPPLMVATESWPPNVRTAASRLRPRGVSVLAAADTPHWPLAGGAFDLVTSRHPVTVRWAEIARVLRPGGTYLAQHVGPESMVGLVEQFRGPLPPAVRRDRHPDDEAQAARAAGLEVVDVRMERLRTEFRDVGAVVWFLRMVVWLVPDFTVDRYRRQLEELHARIAAGGPFVAHSTRVLIEVRRPVSAG